MAGVKARSTSVQPATAGIGAPFKVHPPTADLTTFASIAPRSECPFTMARVVVQSGVQLTVYPSSQRLVPSMNSA